MLLQSAATGGTDTQSENRWQKKPDTHRGLALS
jgi:hypothetical protein